MASEAMNSRFSDMFKAFQYVDMDRSGTLDKNEISRALDLWNIPIEDAKLNELILSCDRDGDGHVDYKEFVDALARDTVAPAAMGKRGMQAKEAMGVESLDKAFLGHGNAPKHAMAKPKQAAATLAPAASELSLSGERMATAPAMAVRPVGDVADPRKSQFTKMASEAMNSRFSDMFKAFQYVDMDRSGTLDKNEISRALDLWNIPIEDAKLNELILSCDRDGDGHVDYKEFVDALARDTVAPAAMGKRGMQAKEAMGVESLDKAFLGHGNAPKHAMAKPKQAAATLAPAASELSLSGERTATAPAMAVRPVGDVADPRKSQFTKMASEAMNSRFSDMFKAFQYVDMDRSGTLDKNEISRALDLWNIPIEDAKLNELILSCDRDGDGHVDYKEFVDALARDTVAPAAMGKRGMQAKEAMGVESLDKAFLGHGNAPKHAMAKPKQAAATLAPAASELSLSGERMATAPAMAVRPVGDVADPRKSQFTKMASEAMNSRFSDMFKAFQYVDMDRSGTLDKNEISRALDLWNIPIEDAKLNELILSCDRDGDGHVDYKEFVDALARDTVAPAAMGKRGMQAKEAMGVESLDKAFLGHGNAPKHAMAKPKQAAATLAPAASELSLSGERMATAPAMAVRPVGDVADPRKSQFTKMASEAMNSRFSDMFKAFQYVDMDRSGTLDKNEISRALDLWNIPIEDAKLNELILSCDRDGDGHVDYKEFVDALARDTVAPAAMGKRGMQAKEAMGVESLDKAFLGHGNAPKHAMAMKQ